MNGGAEQMPDPVSEGQPERPADNNPQYGAADIAAADAGTEGTGQAKSEEDSDKRDRDPERGRGQQDGHQWQQGAGGERQCRRGSGLDGADEIVGVNVQLSVEMGG